MIGKTNISTRIESKMVKDIRILRTKKIEVKEKPIHCKNRATVGFADVDKDLEKEKGNHADEENDDSAGDQL